jgi:hypothetical protein
LAAIKSALSEVLRDLLPNVVCSARFKDPKHPELLPYSIGSDSISADTNSRQSQAWDETAA